MKKVSYSPEISLSRRARPARVPPDVLSEQVRASMAIEGRAIVAELAVKPTRAATKAVSEIAARSITRRETRGA